MMKIGIVAKCLMDEPHPTADELDLISDNLMDALLDAAAEDPAVSVDFAVPAIDIEIVVDGRDPVEAFRRGRRLILDVVNRCQILVSRLDEHHVPTREPVWEIIPETAHDGDLQPA